MCIRDRYVAGPLIGLTVPLLLLLGNKSFGISSSMRHICAACFPADISYFKYDWKKERWNLFFVAGILAGAFIAASYLSSAAPHRIAAGLQQNLAAYNIHDTQSLIPVSYTHLDVYKRQGICRHCSAH